MLASILKNKLNKFKGRWIKSGIN